MFTWNSQRTWWQKSILIFQWLIPVLSIYFVWIIIDSKSENHAFLQVWNHAFKVSYVSYFILFMFILTAASIYLESLKWKYSFGQLFPITHSESLHQTFLSSAAGFVTPLRSGSLLTRIMANQQMDAFSVLNATLRMAIAQFTITFFIGSLGLIYFFMQQEMNEWAILSGLFSLTGLVLILFFPKLPFTFYYKDRKWDGIVIDKTLIALSFFRYLFFSVQFVILLLFFNVQANFVFLYALVSITYLVNSLLPSGALGKLGIRELSGILIIGEATGFILETSCAAFFIWIFNQALPALIGSVLFMIRNIR